MSIKLGAPDSSKYFKFKIGDKVRIKFTEITGIVIDGDCYPELGLRMTFYQIKASDSLTYTYLENDIELLQQ